MTVAELLAAHGIADLGDAMREHLEQQRWFGGRERTVTGVEIVDAAELSTGDPVCLFVISRVSFADGGEVLYNTPLGIRDAEHPMGEVDARYRIAIIEHMHQPRIVYDAFADNDCSVLLWRLMADQTRIETAVGAISAESTGITAPADSGAIRLLTAEQSNTSLALDTSDFVKWIRRIDAGPSIEREMISGLSAAGFAEMATPLGGIDYHRPGDDPYRIAFAHRFLPNATEGWALALTSLRDLYADAEEPPGDVDQAPASTAAVARQGGSFLPEAARLGQVTADMHRALASDIQQGDMRAVTLDHETLDRWADEMHAELDRLLGSDNPRLDPLRRRRDAIAAHFDALRTLDAAGLATRIHGDYHLGQVMRTDDGWVILDFEGEPARPASERRLRSSALRDVAGMLRSFDYAAAAALAERMTPHHPRWDELVLAGQAWAHANREAFWAAYKAHLHDTVALPPGDAALVLRRAFEMQKAVYEVLYELGHRPDWVDIPLGFLLRVSA